MYFTHLTGELLNFLWRSLLVFGATYTNMILLKRQQKITTYSSKRQNKKEMLKKKKKIPISVKPFARYWKCIFFFFFKKMVEEINQQ